MKKIFRRWIVFLCLGLANFSYANSQPANFFSLQTGSFMDQGNLPVRFTCDGKDITPEMYWVNIPPKTKSLALVLSDPDAPDGIFYHWIVYNIPISVKSFPEGMSSLPTGAVVGKNSWNKTEYNGPCPPKGQTHLYIFTLYALDAKLPVNNDLTADMLLDLIQKHRIEKVEVTAIYGRNNNSII